MFWQKVFILLLASLFCLIKSVECQEASTINKELNLTIEDSIFAINLPKLEVPKNHKLKTAESLPSSLDNYLLPFFRPNFSQQSYWNCGQSAGVGYNFTYEINVLKGVRGDTSINQYSPNFTFNFMNYGRGWGVSYFNSFEAIAACGNPNLDDYGPLFNVGYLGWKSGYRLYENAMKNRITGVYAIDVGTPDGLLMLKNWLYDHLNGSAYGGVANYYLGGDSQVYYLPPDSPDAGYSVNISLNYPATHAMTITGYNDSVCFDINYDGQYTNDLDITGDGIVDMQDWEIGALKYMNSWTNNDGQGYLMYRALALPYGKGGPWNQQMHVIKVVADFKPLAIMRLKIRHTSRNKIKIVAGISAKLENNYPDYTMDFPIFNFQGGDNNMQGADTIDQNKELEFSLDISPLLSYINSGEPAKFFVQVIENDKNNFGKGEIQYFAITNGSGIANEIIEFEDVPAVINDNSITTLNIVNTLDFEKVEITTDELPTLDSAQNQTMVIEAQGGHPPYTWSIEKKYTHNKIVNNFINITDEKLLFENNIDSYDTVELPFSFPFYGDTVNKIYVSVDGVILFKPEYHPYPYFIGEPSQLKEVKMIAPFLSNLSLVETKGDGVWIKKNNDNVIIRWQASNEFINSDNQVNFEAILYRDGTIETHYGYMNYPDNEAFVVGISVGDKNNFIINSQNQKSSELAYTSTMYRSLLAHNETIGITQSGELNIATNGDLINHPITIKVKDSKGIHNKKTFLLTQSDLRVNHRINHLESNIVNFNEESSIDLVIKNTSGSVYKNLNINIYSEDEYIILNDSLVNIGEILAGQEITINDFYSFEFASDVPDKHNSKLICELTYEGGSVSTDIIVETNSPKYVLLSNKIIDNDNSFLYPGETALIKQTIQNVGHAESNKAFCRIKTDNPNIHISEEPFEIPALVPGDTISFDFEISANYQIPLGEKAYIDLIIFNDNGVISTETSEIYIGHVPILIFENDQNQMTGFALMNILEELGLNYDYYITLPNHLDNYLSVFVCLGGLFNLIDLSPMQEELLIEYLNSNGNVYLEGRKKWTSPQQTSLLNMFNINSDEIGPFQIFDTIFGTNSELTKSMLFTNNDNAPVISSFIHPIEGAFSILKTQHHDSSDVTVAYDEGSYKTIGSNILFGSLVDEDSLSTKKNYLLSILDFFDIKKYIYVGIEDENEDLNKEIDLNVFPNPSDGNITIELKNSTRQPTTIIIFDLFGNSVYEQTINKSIYNSPFSINIDKTEFKGNRLANGIYIIQIVSGENIVNKKLIIK